MAVRHALTETAHIVCLKVASFKLVCLADLMGDEILCLTCTCTLVAAGSLAALLAAQRSGMKRSGSGNVIMCSV